VFIIHFRLIMFVAENTLKNGIIGRIDVAVGAILPLPFVFPGIDGEILGVMIPVGLVPVGSIMALLAIRGESRGLVVGIIGIVIIILVAGVAIRGRAAVSVGMAIQALQDNVRPGQGKLGLIVIESCRLPGAGTVALSAVIAEIVLHVIGIVYRGKVAFVAGVAIRRGIGITVLVAFKALQGHVRAGQGELGLAVIKRCRLPGGGAMAYVALVAEIILHVVGIVRRGKIAFMAGKTIARQRGELAVFVAAFTGYGLMRAGKGKRG